MPRSPGRRGAKRLVDFLWREQRLVVEVDGFAFHSSRDAFERDRRRDADLQARGLRTTRVTFRQIAHEPEALLANLAVQVRQDTWERYEASMRPMS